MTVTLEPSSSQVSASPHRQPRIEDLGCLVGEWRWHGLTPPKAVCKQTVVPKVNKRTREDHVNSYPSKLILVGSGLSHAWSPDHTCGRFHRDRPWNVDASLTRGCAVFRPTKVQILCPDFCVRPLNLSACIERGTVTEWWPSVVAWTRLPARTENSFLGAATPLTLSKPPSPFTL